MPEVAFDSASALFSFDESLRVGSWNRAAEELTGVPARAAVGRPCWEVLRGRDEEGRCVCHRGCPIARLARAGRPVPTRSLVVRGRETRAVSVETIVVHGSSGVRFLHLLRPCDEAETTARTVATPTVARYRDAGASSVPPARTLDDVFAQLAPDRTWRDLLDWPPDAFAICSAALCDSSAYRLVVSPRSRRWPPAETWKDEVRAAGRAWAAATTQARTQVLPAACATLARAIQTLEASSEVRLGELGKHWDAFTALVTLHAAADEASAGVLETDPLQPPFPAKARTLLAAHGSLAHLAPERARVLPKLRVPSTGLTARSLSRHLCLDRSEVETHWHVRPERGGASREKTLTMLLVPYPSSIRPTDVREVPGPLWNMDRSRSGFFEFEPSEPLEADEIARLVERAATRAGRLDVLVLPEAAIDATALPAFRAQLAGAPVEYLIAGIREPAAGEGLGANYAFVGAAGAGGWNAEPQHKHHRWCVDGAQIEQYGFDLDSGRRWWEAIGIHRRTLTFVSIGAWLTICPLVCEDLVRPDPVADVIRGVGPTLIVALLLDGPQLAPRWPARYASVLAEDPGSSVLTLTALGMVERSRPPGLPPSRVVALWKDSRQGLQELAIEEGAGAILLTTAGVASVGISADGRQDDLPATELTFVSAEQIS